MNEFDLYIDPSVDFRIENDIASWEEDGKVTYEFAGESSEDLEFYGKAYL